MPRADPAKGKTAVEAHGKSFALLLGRRTDDIWADYRPTIHSNPMADRMNANEKALRHDRRRAWAVKKSG